MLLFAAMLLSIDMIVFNGGGVDGDVAELAGIREARLALTTSLLFQFSILDKFNSIKFMSFTPTVINSGLIAAWAFLADATFELTFVGIV